MSYLLYPRKKSEQLNGRDESRDLSSLAVVIVIDFRKSTEGTMTRSEEKNLSRGGRLRNRENMAHVSSQFSRSGDEACTRSQRQVSGDPEIRNGCERPHRMGVAIESGRMPLLRRASSGRDLRGAERTGFPRSTLVDVDHGGKNTLNTPLMSRLRSPIACGYAISPPLTLPL